MTKYRRHVELYRAKQSLAIECHTMQLPQFRDCMTYSAFRCRDDNVSHVTSDSRLLTNRDSDYCSFQSGPLS